MLIKLIKQEFRATGRIMLPLILAMLMLTFMSGFATRYLDAVNSSRVLTVLSLLVVIMFFAAIFAVGASAFVVMIQRFYKNLLGDEGYLMFTLPVSADALIWAKLIVSSIWFILTAILCSASMLILVSFNYSGSNFLKDIIMVLRDCSQTIGAGNMAVLIAEGLVYVFVDLFVLCLHFYLALAIGHSFANHKMFWSVAAFFGISILCNVLGVLAISFAMSFEPLYNLIDSIGNSLNSALEAVLYLHGGMWLFIAATAFVGALFYIPTRLLLKHRVNLA